MTSEKGKIIFSGGAGGRELRGHHGRRPAPRYGRPGPQPHHQDRRLPGQPGQTTDRLLRC